MRVTIVIAFIFLTIFCLKAQGKIVYDSTIKLADLSKIKSLEEIVKYPKTCKIHQYSFFYKHDGKLKSEDWAAATYSLGYVIERCFTKPKKGDFFIIEFIKASCTPIIGHQYKFKID